MSTYEIRGEGDIFQYFNISTTFAGVSGYFDIRITFLGVSWEGPSFKYVYIHPCTRGRSKRGPITYLPTYLHTYPCAGVGLYQRR